jgi:hypothetical protein
MSSHRRPSTRAANLGVAKSDIFITRDDTSTLRGGQQHEFTVEKLPEGAENQSDWQNGRLKADP